MVLNGLLMVSSRNGMVSLGLCMVLSCLRVVSGSSRVILRCTCMVVTGLLMVG